MNALIRVFHEEEKNLMKKLAQPALQVFGGCFDFDFEFDKFFGVHKSFPFWPFLHCRFSLSLHSVWQSEGWVKIYNVKEVKTEMTYAPPKT